MKLITGAVLVLFLSLAGAGCSLQETPPEVWAEYQQLTAAFDEDRLGESIGRLEEFRARNGQYLIAHEVEKELEARQAKVAGRFQQARDLARDGSLERAQLLLEDLATHLPGTADGRNAAKYLAFEFQIFKAQRLMMDRKVAEAEAVLRPLREQRLSPARTRQLEALLDSVSTAGRSMQMAEEAQARNAARVLQMMLERRMVESGRYPESLDLDELAGRGAERRPIRDGLSAIEDYRATADAFSLIAVSAGGAFRFKVTESGVEPLAQP